MNNNLNELMELKNYVNYLIEMVLSEEEKLKQSPRIFTNDPLGFGQNKNNNPYLDKLKSDSNVVHKNDPGNRDATDKIIGFFSKHGKRFDSNNPIEKKLVNADADKIFGAGPHEKDPVIKNVAKKQSAKWGDPLQIGRELPREKDLLQWEKDYANKKTDVIQGPIPLRDMGRHQAGPAYVRDAANLLSQKAKATNAKVSSDNEYSKIAEKRVAEQDRLKAYQNSPQAYIDDAKRNPGKAAVAGAAGLAGLGLAGYAAYKLAKKRKAEKEKANKK